MGLKRVRRGVAVLVCAVAAVPFAQTARAAVGPGADVIAGTPLPALPEVQRSIGLAAAPGYVAYDDRPLDQYADSTMTLHRVSDGAAIRDIPIPDSATEFRPVLSGDAVVRVIPAADGWRAGQYVVDDLVTGAERSRITIPSGDGVLADTAAGLLVRRPAFGDPHSEHILEPDGTDVEVGGTQQGWGPVGASDATTVFQSVGGRMWAIDVASGQHRDLGAAPGLFLSAWPTPHRVYWSDQYWDGDWPMTLHWSDRDGGNPGSATFVPSQRVDRFLPLGDGLAVETATGANRFSMAPFDVTTGQVGAPLATEVTSAAPTGDGSLALSVADTTRGHVELLEPGQAAPRTVAEFQPEYERARGIALDGDTVTVDVGDPFSTSPGPLLANTLGDTDWEPTPTPPGPSPSPYVPPTSWTATQDGTTWTWHTDAPVITATGTTGSVTAPCAGPDPTRGSGKFVVRGRWALVGCAGQDWIVDLSGRTADWPVPEPAGNVGVELGIGFLAVGSYRTVAPGEDYAVLTVHELSAQHESRVYGPLAGVSRPPNPAFVLDAGGSPRIAYLDGGLQPRMITLDWLPDYGPLDTAGPAITATGGSDVVSADLPIQATWTATDDTNGALPGSGVASYDVRYRAGSSTDWITPDDLQGTTATSASIPSADGQTACWSVRARDDDGNVGNWSADRCVTTDRTAPIVSNPSAGPSVVAAVTSTSVTFGYAARDASGVASYDVSYRLAGRGGALGPVVAPAAWQHTTSTSQRLTVTPGGEACFSVRARDRAGNVSVSSAWSCAAVPLDDRSMAAGPGSALLTSAGALGRTVIKLVRSGARVTLAAQQGSRVAVIAIAGPGQGSVDVYAGGGKIGHISLAAPTWRRVTTLLPMHPFTGTVVINSVATAPSEIDGVAVLR